MFPLTPEGCTHPTFNNQSFLSDTLLAAIEVQGLFNLDFFHLGDAVEASADSPHVVRLLRAKVFLETRHGRGYQNVSLDRRASVGQIDIVRGGAVW
ncbi:MAG: hypothetical protein IJ113_07930 [Eggerthellaceae bacterium]|nr:hypothetical protein [Eggerthellaceae bacterium]